MSGKAKRWRDTAAVVLAGAALVTPCCRPGGGAAEETLVRFMEAVQAEDLDRLYCMLAGAADSSDLGRDAEERRANFASWAAQRYESYEEGRDRGRVGLDGEGITAVKLFALGRGTFYTFSRPVSAGEGLLSVETELRFGYAHIDLSRLMPGTTFYLCGVPVGTVHPVRVPSRPTELTLDVLDALKVRWTLVSRPANAACPGGWTVASAIPVEGSEISKELTWVF